MSTISISRRSALRGLAAFSAMTAINSGLRMYAETNPQTHYSNPFPNDITVFFVGPWLLVAGPRDRPNSIVALTRQHRYHDYIQGIYRAGEDLKGKIPFGDSQVTVPRPSSPTRTSGLFSSHNQEMLAVDNSCQCVTLTPGIAKLRRIILPVPDDVFPIAFVSRDANKAPLFQWPNKPTTQLLPTRAATALILKYSNATTLSFGSNPPAKTGDHYHFRLHVKHHWPKGDNGFRAQQTHIVDFSKSLATTFLVDQKSPDLSFDPGEHECIDVGRPDVDPAEVGVLKACSSGVSEQILPHLHDYTTGDCGGAIMTIDT